MGTFVLTVFTANATGPLCAAWVAQKLNWHVSLLLSAHLRLSSGADSPSARALVSGSTGSR